MDRDTKVDSVVTAIGRIPSGVAILTASNAGRSTGMLASWYQQASFEPPMVSVCVKRGRPIEALIDGSKRFVLNLLGENPSEMFRHFGSGFGPDDDAFKDLAVQRRDYGVQLDASIGHVGCQVETKVTAGDHFIYVGRAMVGGVSSEGRPHVHLRKSGQNY